MAVGVIGEVAVVVGSGGAFEGMREDRKDEREREKRRGGRKTLPNTSTTSGQG